MHNLLELIQHGQSYWLDNLTRGMIRGGDLERRVREQGLRGVTSNPAIFHKAISTGSDYDEQIRELAGVGTAVGEMYETLVVTDIREACEALHSVYEASAGADGYVSLEVSPHLIHDTSGSVEEARRLWAAVDRPNLMIKIPGTAAGAPAIEELLYDGINVNVTLLFSVEAYETVARAYVRALQRRLADGRSLDAVASVASFFLSRIDVMVDRLLSHRIGAPATPAPQDLIGRAAVASARLAYRAFRTLSASSEWQSLAAAGARPQRLLWASTSTKNPLYDPVRYVEPLVGRDTVNTMPEVTIEAFASSGRIAPDAVERDIDDAEQVFAGLAAVGIDMAAVHAQLLAEGAQKFIDPFDALLNGLAGRRAAMREASGVESRGPIYEPPELPGALVALREQRFAQRLHRRDPTLWDGDAATREAIAERLGWIRCPEEASRLAPELATLADEVRAEGVRHVVLIGMGGSSLCPLVARDALPAANGYPELRVLDDVDPGTVARLDADIDFFRTLFVVASKSGSTIETMTLYRYFAARLASERIPAPGRHFVAITDRGSPLLQEAEEAGFRRVFQAPSDVGGRYSALTTFGLLPMALMGADVGKVVSWAREMSLECSPALPESANPAVRLGARLALLARAGRNMLTIAASPSLATFPLWIEQLVAESTGKNGVGILPVTHAALPTPAACEPDRVFLGISLAGEEVAATEGTLDALEQAGHPVVRFALPEPEALGGEFLRWEIATATAGTILGVNPFDEPDVSAAKRATADLLDRRATAGGFPTGKARASTGPLYLFTNGDAEHQGETTLAEALSEQLESGEQIGYVAVLGFFGATPERDDAIVRLRARLEARTGRVTTFGYGPRYLHSTGQLHKGGRADGLYFVLTADPVEDLDVPASDVSLGTLQRAQALGDVQTLRHGGRKVIHAHLGWDVEGGMARLIEAI
jgi:transaldolase/glucose-6-phosphate isomerase